MSKTTVTLAGILILSAGILAGWSVPQGEDPAVLLRAAIEKEEVDGDLEAAIAQYKHVIKIAGTNRAVAAQALLRLGGCYEKRGPEEARRTYQQLIRDYGEQAKEVAAARQRLAALTAGAPAPARAGDSRLTIRRVPKLGMDAKPSPDGKYLAFVDDSSGDLAVLDEVTGATRKLTSDGSYRGQTIRSADFSAWSHDSRRIVCGWGVRGPKETGSELRIVSVEGDAPSKTIVIPGARWNWPRDWSPDGSQILCGYGPEGGGSMLALVSVASGAIDNLDVPAGGWGYQFTSDGNAILYSASADGKSGPRDIFLRSLGTGATRAIVEHPAEDLLVGVLPGTDWLFFASDRRGPLDLWAVRFRQGKADGQPVLVKQGLGRLFPLGFTNNGRYYYATLSATDDIFLADFDRDRGRVIGEARKWTSRWDGFSGSPAFSPDGASLAYLAKRSPMPFPTGAFDSLVVQSLKDRAAEPVVVGFEEFGIDGVIDPCWLPDGRTIVLGGYRGLLQESALFRVDLPSLQKTRVYSPADGRRLVSQECASGEPSVFVSLITPGIGQTTERPDRVVRIDGAGGNEREVFRTPQGQGFSGIALSPDGRSLSIVTRLDRNRRALWVVPSEGGTPRQIHEFREPSGGGVSHVWAPDGRSILYVQRSDSWEKEEDRAFFLRSVRADGAEAAPETVFRWPGQFFGLRFHPNGRLLAFTGRSTYSTSSEVWVIENLREEMKLLAPPATR
jgi:Tol biopolymer transport system component